MDINDLLEQTMKAINEYVDEIVAERMKLKMSPTGPSPEAKGKNAESLRCAEKHNDTHFPKKA